MTSPSQSRSLQGSTSTLGEAWCRAASAEPAARFAVDSGSDEGGGGGGGGGGTGSPDLQAGAKSSTGSPAPGSTFTLTFTARNVGKVDAENPVFTATLPAGMTALATTYDFGSCTVSGALVSCTTTHPVVPGATAVATVTLAAPSVAGAYSTTSAWSTSNGDANPSDNSAAISVTVK